MSIQSIFVGNRDDFLTVILISIMINCVKLCISSYTLGTVGGKDGTFSTALLFDQK